MSYRSHTAISHMQQHEQSSPPSLELETESKNYLWQRLGSPLIIGACIIIAGLLVTLSVIVSAAVLAYKVVPKINLANGNNPAALVPIALNLPQDLYSVGPANAVVTVVEFADFQCPYCGEFHKNIFPQLKKDYIDTGKVKFIFADYAFLGDESVRASEAARCAGEQNQFWAYHDLLFSRQNGENEGGFSDDKLKGWAEELKLNISDFNQCLDSRKMAPHIAGTLEIGSSAKVSGTPAVFVNGTQINGLAGYNEYKNLIEKKLKD